MTTSRALLSPASIAASRDHPFDPLLESPEFDDPLGLPRPKPVLSRFDSARELPLSWLWPGRIRIGELTLLTGPPAIGKSFLALDLAARLSSGRPLPSGNGVRDPRDRS